MIRRLKDEKTVVSIGPLDLDVTYNCYQDSGNVSGPIDSAYPPESELELVEVTYSGEDVFDLLSEYAINKIEAKCWEDAQATWDDHDNVAADFAYDAAREDRMFGR